MKQIKVEGVKPVLYFKCGLCGCEWFDTEYEVKETPCIAFMMNMRNKLPTSECPTCKLPSTNYNKVEQKGAR